MGATVSAGADNDELVDNLLEADYIKTLAVERVFRAVDRGHYFTLESRENAYKDLAWKYGNVHISAPCIYSEVMENLQLAPGMSFLNLGSGTGYLSTMAGLILGSNGINHGVEIHEDVLEYARRKLEEFCMTSPAIDEYEFCQPKFVSGNCLHLDADTRQYDRVYCGAACPENHKNYMKNLIKVGGILVMPINNQLLQIYRISEDMWETRTVLPVSFASLISGNSENIESVRMPDADPLSLQDICRFAVRSILRQKINKEHPELRSDTLQESKMRIKKRTLRKFVIPIFGNNAEHQSEITPEDLNGLRDFGRRGFLMDVQSVRSCRTLLELLPGPSNRMLTSGEEGDAEGEYDGNDEDEYEDLEDYEDLDEEDLEELGIYDEDEEDDEDEDNDNENENENDNDNGNDNDNDVDIDVDVDVDDNEDGGIQEDELDDVGMALQDSDNPGEEKGMDDLEMMETDTVPMTRSRARKSARMSSGKSTGGSSKSGTRNSNKNGSNRNSMKSTNRNSMKSATRSIVKTSTKTSTASSTVTTSATTSTTPSATVSAIPSTTSSAIPSAIPSTSGCSTSYDASTSSKMTTRSSMRNAKSSPTTSTDSSGPGSRMTTRSTARRSARNVAGPSMTTRRAARSRSASRMMSRMNTRPNTRMGSMMGTGVGSRMGGRAGARAGGRMGPRGGPRASNRLRRRVDYDDGLDDTLGSRFLRHITMGEDPDADPDRYMDHFDPDEKILVRFEDSDTESFMNDAPEKEENATNYSTYMREKIRMLPLPMSLKHFVNFNRDL